MEREILTLNRCSFELLREGDTFIGLGVIEIDNRKVRCGRLPISPYSETFSANSLCELKLMDIVKSDGEIRIKSRALFNPMSVKLMKDHWFDIESMILEHFQTVLTE